MSTKISKVVRAGYARKAKSSIQKLEVVHDGGNSGTCDSVGNVDKEDIKNESDKKVLKRENNVDFEYHIKQIEIMRERADAPVDSVGCHKLADETADPKTYRFQVVLSLLLSSQTKDEITAGAMGRLKNYGCTVDKMIRTDNNTIEDLLKPVSFYRRKAANIIRIAAILKDQYDDDIPRTFNDLCKLPGIGPKMANLIMLVAWKECVGIAVDTHIHRIVNRLHWVKTTDPIKTEKEIEDLLPRHHWTTINTLFVGFGQTICKAVAPLCDSCLLNDVCPSAQIKKKKKKGNSDN
uniref:Endonuclease III homolog n=1 Tax=Strongyloides papillosus TaxID=174720 RepID=A0A0N5C711_STREA